MINAKSVNSILNIDDSYKAPEALMAIVLDADKLKETLNQFLQLESNLDYEWFQKYFEDEHSDRKNKKQDFTPVSISSLLEKLAGKSNSYFEAAAGTGGIMIQSWKENKEKKDRCYYLEELSGRSIPFLLFNMAIRHINGYVFHGDSLKEKYEAVYRLKDGTVTLLDKYDAASNFFESVIMNPPFSADWDADKALLEDPRFKNYGGKLAPKSKADFAFLLHGYDRLDAGGTMAIVLPHGVLFRGAAEGAIRTALLEQGAIEAVIGLPGKLFLNTQIPTCILILKKDRQKKDVLFIDASNEFEKGNNGQNLLNEDHIKQIVETYRNKESIDKYSLVVDFEEVKDNDYNLNIPRYVDTFEEEEPIDMGALALDIMRIDAEIAQNEKELLRQMEELTVPSGDPKQIQDLELIKRMFGKKPNSNRPVDNDQIDLMQYLEGAGK